VLDVLSTTPQQTRHTVTAIIVAHDGARLLPGLVRALRAQTYPVERTVGVDTGSRDRSGAVLAELIGEDAVFGMDRDTGYGEAVAVALQHSAARRTPRTDPNLTRVEWIWLLHDDCEPTPETLERLLRAASRDRAVVVLGPKVLDGQDRRTLREVGVSIDRAGRRITGIEPGEIDQGQHDHNRMVLAVGSAGMLVRRDAWEQLGGFDTRLKLFRDDLDFCWRAQGAGYRVQVVTDAILYHRELSARRRRNAGERQQLRRLDRRNALYVLAVNLPLVTMLRVMAGCVAGSMVRAAYFLLTKQLDLAAAQVYGVAGLAGHPVWLWRGRRRRAATRHEAYSAARSFIPPGRTLSRLAESVAGLLSSGPPQASGGMHQAASEEPEDEQFTDAQSVVRRIIANPGVQLFVALTVVALIAERRLLGTSPLGGGALVPAWGSAAGLWSEYLAGFHAVGIGSTASAPPYLAVVAALATVLGGQSWLAVDVLLLGSVPLAGMTAYLATRRIATATAARVLLAAAYALLPVATGAVAAGRLGTAFAFAILPLIGVSAGRMVTAPPRPARRAAWATGLLLALATAFAPLVWVLGVICVVFVLAVRRVLWAMDPVNAIIVAVTPFAVLFPWSLHLFASPSAFLTEAGIQSPALTSARLGPSALLLLSPGGPGVPPIWVTAGLGLAVLAALLPHRRTDVTIGGWCVAVVGLLAAIAVSRISITPAGGGPSAKGWPGVAMAVAALGLLIAAAPAAQWLAEMASSRVGGISRGTAWLLAGAGLAVAASAPVLVAGYWVTVGVRGPVGSVSAPVLPAFISASAATGGQNRTLVLRPDGDSIDYTVVRQSDPILGEPELTAAASATAALSRQVAGLGAPDGADAGDPGLSLGEFGIKWVMLPGPVDPVLAQRLDAAVGLVPLSKAPAYDLWQVSGPVSRVRVVAQDGTITSLSAQPVGMTAVSAPASGGTLELAEPAGGWTATLNGVALKPLAAPVDGWAQGFTLPPGGGRLTITRNDMARAVSLIVELIALLAVCVLALPGKRAEPAEEADALAALRAAQHDKRAARAAQRPRLSERYGLSGSRAPQAARSGHARAGRAAPAGALGALGPLGTGAARRRAASRDISAEDPVTTGSGVGVLDDEDEPGMTEDWDEPAHDPWTTGPFSAAPRETGPHQAAPRETGPHQAAPRETGPHQAAPWETGPHQVPPWETGPHATTSRETGPHPAGPRETGPHPSASLETGPHPTRETGPHPAGPRETGPHQALPPGTGPHPTASRETGPHQAEPPETGPRPPAPRTTGAHRAPSRGTGPKPAPQRGTGPHPAGPQETGPQRAGRPETGPHPAAARETGPYPAAARETGPHPAPPWETGPHPTQPRGTGPHPAPPRETGPKPAMAPWETGEWGRPADGNDTREHDSATWGETDGRGEPAWRDESSRDESARGDEAGRQDDPARSDDSGRRAEPPERHSHRASRHSRPGRPGRLGGLGRRRGSGNRGAS
jgi:GT2 family glycosyltransferase